MRGRSGLPSGTHLLITAVPTSTPRGNEAIDLMTKQTALQIAREECARRGWSWNEDTSVKRGLFAYTVWGGGRKGGNLCIKIRKKDGAVLSATLSPK